MSGLVTYCKRHDVAVYPNAGKKYLAEFHERHKDCCQALEDVALQARIEELEAGIRETIAATQLSKVARITGEATIHPFFVDKLAALLETSDE